MANENPKGDQVKKQSPTKQTPNNPAQPVNPPRQAASQGKPAPDQGARPRTPAMPASLAKPGGRPDAPQSGDPRRSTLPQANRPVAQGRAPERNENQPEGDVFGQRVFDPDASDTVPVQPGRFPAGGGGRNRNSGGRDRLTGSGPSQRPSAPVQRPPASSGSDTRRPISGPARPASDSQGHAPQQSHTQQQRRPQQGQGGRSRPVEATAGGGAKLPAAGRAAAAPAAAPVTEVVIPATITVRELAEKMHRSPIEVIKTLMNYGMMIPITESIDFDTAQLIGEELGVTVKTEKAPEPEVVVTPEEAPKTLRQKIMASEKEGDLVLRPPIVTVLGHVDHGKTTLLDAIRETRVVDGEAGGITQHIGAYQVERDGRLITFLDTPGHEAFTAMRARGAQVTDIAVLVVAADDGVMPQTKEAIAHAKAAQVPIVVALNKIDKPNANPDRVKQELADNGVLIEEYGGDVVCVPVSAKMRRGIGDLLENILLVTDIDPQMANPKGECIGTVVESRLDKTRGPMATLLVQNGTLHVGDSIVTGETYAKIRAMLDDKGEPITEALPAAPVAILGLAEVPTAGDTFRVVADDRTARAIASERIDTRRAATAAPAGVPRTLESFFAAAESGQVKELNLILKADVQGSIEPIVNSLEKLGDEKLKVKILHQATGNITEGDVMLASASKAAILGFSVNVDGTAQHLAETEHVEIRQYNIIYNIIEDVQKALTGLLEPVYKEVILGHAEVRAVFRVTKVGKVAGCMVTDGELLRNSMARIKRGGQVLREDKIVSIKRFQEDVPEVKTGFECGLNFGNFNDFEVGDIIEAYKKERVS